MTPNMPNRTTFFASAEGLEGPVSLGPTKAWVGSVA